MNKNNSEEIDFGAEFDNEIGAKRIAEIEAEERAARIRTIKLQIRNLEERIEKWKDLEKEIKSCMEQGSYQISQASGQNKKEISLLFDKQIDSYQTVKKEKKSFKEELSQLEAKLEEDLKAQQST